MNRLKPLKNSLIAPYQNAFIKGRNITNNILIAHEILDALRKKKGRQACFGVLKIDMSKAYDKVDWTFLKAVLIVMKFKDRWIQWITECVTSVSYTLLVNGNFTSSFKPFQGLRQGILSLPIYSHFVPISFLLPYYKLKIRNNYKV